MKLFRTIKEVTLTSLPLAAITVIVCCFVAPMPHFMDYVKLLAGYAGVVFGSSIFLVGLDESIIPIGKHVGGSLIKLKKPAFIVLFGVIFGVLATVAEPALWVLAKQTHMLMPYVKDAVLVWVLSSGVGVFVGFSLWRIMANHNIKWVFAILYAATFACVLFVPAEFIALAFDGSGATTGDVSVPFILALGLGVSATMSKSKTNDDTFGIIGLASVGPILALFLYGIIKRLAYPGGFPAPGDYNPGGDAAGGFLAILAGNSASVALALVPVLIVFLPFQHYFIKLPKKEFKQVLLGTATVYVGLLVFLSGIDYGFAYASKYIGEIFMAEGRPDWFKWMLLPIGFILGAAITMSEPAVTVLGEQLEEITNGHTKRMTIRVTLALGIGVASLLAMVKILTETNILWYLLPLYAISLAMMPGTSKLFVGLAFDSGGVSGGALTSAFLTPFTLGAAQAIAARAGGEGAVSAIVNGFGIIAFVSVTPLISVQALGMIYELRMRAERKRLAAAEQAQIGELLALARENEPEEPAPKEPAPPKK
jgi:Protein of unknown function (DUF1538).